MKCSKSKNARGKVAKERDIFRCSICKFVTVLLPSSSWLLKLPRVPKRVTFLSQPEVNNRK